MALQPIDSCTTLDYDPSSLPACTLNIAQNISTYPSWWDCPVNGTTPEGEGPSTYEDTFCYVVENKDHYYGNVTNGVRQGGLREAMNDCCNACGPGSLSSCVLFCCVDDSVDLENFNSCLSGYGLGPSYNGSGYVRDTYCVPSRQAQENGAKVQTAGPNTTTTTTSGAERRVNGRSVKLRLFFAGLSLAVGRACMWL